MKESNQFNLLIQKRFSPFFFTQFLGAFNDNVFRNGLVILLTFQGANIAGMNASQLANVAGALFILPYFFFSATAGQLTDKYEKSNLIRKIKIFEIILMIMAAYALTMKYYAGLLIILFFMGFQSALFSPAKYSYIPQHLSKNELIGGNALVESGTYIAIILGLMVGGIAVSMNYENNIILSACLICLAAFGYFTSRGIPKTKSVDPALKINWNIFTETSRIIGFAKRDQGVMYAIIGISWFWFYGSAVTLQIPAYTLNIINGNEVITTTLLATFAIGIGIGSLLCEKLSGYRIEIGLVPLGSIGLTLFSADLYFAKPIANMLEISFISEFLSAREHLRILFDLTMIGLFGGLYSVPLYAMLQERAERKKISRIIAANNILNAIFMVSASLFAIITLSFGMSIPQFFLILAGLNGIVSIYIYCRYPAFFVRFLKWIFRK
jgi:hypothetical protein